jgi:multimeric flavodoxin WrbA
MTKITIAYHSGYGRTKVQAEYILKGLKEVKGVETYFIDVTTIDDKGWKQLDDSNAIIFGSPTYMGSVSAKFKEFMEATGKKWFEQKWKDKFVAGFTNSGGISGDKLLVLQELVIFACQHSMIWISQGLMADQSKPAGDVSAINRTGSYLGCVAQSNNTDPEPAKGDLETARLFGKRVAEFVVKHRG